MTWNEFVERKDRTRKEVLERAAARVEAGCPSRYNLDLDMLPIISTWDRIPFSFTTQSCSGTPKEHNCKHYSPVNGLEGNANSILYAHSYMGHPLFEPLRSFLEASIANEADTTKSHAHGLKEYGGLYLHMIEVWVPEEVKASGNLEYLDGFWNRFNRDLKEFVQEHKASRDWFWNGKETITRV